MPQAWLVAPPLHPMGHSQPLLREGSPFPSPSQATLSIQTHHLLHTHTQTRSILRKEGEGRGTRRHAGWARAPSRCSPWFTATGLGALLGLQTLQLEDSTPHPTPPPPPYPERIGGKHAGENSQGHRLQESSTRGTPLAEQRADATHKAPRNARLALARIPLYTAPNTAVP